MQQQKMFNTQASSTLAVIFSNLPMVVFATTIGIRLLVAVPVAIVSVKKFAFFGSPVLAVVLGVASVLFLETLLTVLSLITSNFRKYEKYEDYANLILVFVLMLVAYNGYMIQSMTDFYEIEYKISALLTLHVLNVLSVVLIESVAHIQAKSEIDMNNGAIQPANNLPPKVKEIIEANITNYEKARRLYNGGHYTSQKEIAELLRISQTSVSRALNNTEQ